VFAFKHVCYTNKVKQTRGDNNVLFVCDVMSNIYDGVDISYCREFWQIVIFWRSYNPK